MPRRREVPKREILPDPVYNSPLVTKFINGIMLGGKKSTAETIFYRALTLIGEKAGDEPLKVFKRAIENVRPTVEVKSRRVGGSTYQVPLEVHQERRGALAIRWIVQYARGRGEQPQVNRRATRGWRGNRLGREPGPSVSLHRDGPDRRSRTVPRSE